MLIRNLKLLVSSLILSTGALLQAQNLVTKGDFGNGFPGWNNLGQAPAVATYSLESAAPYAGTKYSDNGGERIDSRSFITDWNAAGFDDSKWQLAVEAPIKATLSAQMMEPTRIIGTIPARSISGNGPAYRVDMGKNLESLSRARALCRIRGLPETRLRHCSMCRLPESGSAGLRDLS